MTRSEKDVPTTPPLPDVERRPRGRASGIKIGDIFGTLKVSQKVTWEFVRNECIKQNAIDLLGAEEALKRGIVSKYYIPSKVRQTTSKNGNAYFVLICVKCGRWILGRADKLLAKKVWCPCQNV